LIHLGLDAIELNGNGFERISQVRANVKIGDPIIRMDINKVKEMNKHTGTPVIILNMDNIIIISV